MENEFKSGAAPSQLDHGSPEAEALRAAALGPAEVFEAADSLGTVKEGELGDLVLLDASPLDDISNTQRIRAVVADGRYYDRIAHCWRRWNGRRGSRGRC